MQEVSVTVSKGGNQQVLRLIFPQSWNELSRQQLLFVADNWTSWQSILRISENLSKVRAILVLALCGLKNKRQRLQLCKALALVNERSGANILECTDFLFQNIDLTKNLLPTVNVGWFKKLYGPGDKLADLTVEEFSFAFGLFNQYNRTGNETVLPTLMACLYRPKNPDFAKTGELRSPFNNKLIDVNEKAIKALPKPYHHAVYLYFLGCIEFLAKNYPNVFSRAESGSKGGGSFFDSVMAISGGKFGPFDSTKNTNLYIILRELERLIKENNKK